MMQGNESNRQRDEGKEESSYEHNRVNFYLLHSTDGDNKRWNMETNCFLGGRRWEVHYVWHWLVL